MQEMSESSTDPSFVTALEARPGSSVVSSSGKHDITVDSATGPTLDTGSFPPTAAHRTNAHPLSSLEASGFPSSFLPRVDASQEEREDDGETSSVSPTPSPPPRGQYIHMPNAGELGASLFSIPPSQRPESGVYDLPVEAFEMRDLDSGRTFYLDKRYWIKDVDTGRVYVMQPEPSVSPSKVATPQGASREREERLRSNVTGMEENMKISDLLTGRELSLKEFERTLGYRGSPSSSGVTSSSETHLDQVRPGHGTKDSPRQQKLSSLTHAAQSSASWVKKKAAAAFDRVASSQGTSRQAGSSTASSMRALAGRAPGEHPSSVGVSPLPSPRSGSVRSINSMDGNGIPIKVTVTRKKYKELTDLRLVQRLVAHEGVVWAAKFSRTGKYLATAGQDCILLVWEVITKRSEASLSLEAGAHSSAMHGEISTPEKSPRNDAASSMSRLDAGAQNTDYSNSTQQRNNNVDLDQRGKDPAFLESRAYLRSGADVISESGVHSPSYGIPVLQHVPVRRYRGHKADILEVAWSKTNFLLSASMDRTVRLWHPSVEDCLRVFKHSDFVTAIDFHPLDDKLFISGSIDGRVRLWNVPDQKVIAWQDVHDMVTAVGMSRDGKRAVVGSMRGKCRFYSAGNANLEYEAQLDVKNKRGQHARGKKVTGVAFAPSSRDLFGSRYQRTEGSENVGNASSSSQPMRNPHTSSLKISTSPLEARQSTRAVSAMLASNPPSLLVTSNDSRIRLYDGYVMKTKYKGHQNRSTQIKASFSPRGDYIICGSDDGCVYIWNTKKSSLPGSPEWNRSQQAVGSSSSRRGAVSSQASANASVEDAAGGTGTKEKNSSFESFQVSNDVVTVALFAPEGTQRKLDTAQEALESSSGVVDVQSAEYYGLRGQVIVTAGYSGEIRIYENIGLPQWL